MIWRSARSQLRAAAIVAPFVPKGPCGCQYRQTAMADLTRSTRRRPGAPPATHVSLSRVGVTGVEKVIRDPGRTAAEQLFYAELECFVDLGPQQKGAHMSRFEEIVNEAIDEVVLGEAFKAETLAAHIAERVRDRQDGLRAEVTIAARYPETSRRPHPARPPRRSTRCSARPWRPRAARAGWSACEAQGMTACPCAQEMVTGALARAAAPTTASPTTRSSASSRPSRWPPTTSAASARSTSAAPRAATSRSRPRRCSRSWRAR